MGVGTCIYYLFEGSLLFYSKIQLMSFLELRFAACVRPQPLSTVAYRSKAEAILVHLPFINQVCVSLELSVCNATQLHF